MSRLPAVRLVTLAVVALVIILLVFFTNWQTSVGADASLTLIANLILVCLTAWYVALTYRLLKTQTDPCVVLFPKREGNLIYLVVENIGKGLAREIKFTASESLKCAPPALACTSDARLEDMQAGPLVQGIPALAPGQHRRMLWGPLHVLSGWMGDRTIEVTCSFSDNDKVVTVIVCPIELHSLSFTGEEYTDAVEQLNDAVADAMRGMRP